ncbi:MAG: tetratricopeptide repeat protein, partial [Candidatus Omnitrophica bacterium]|nr:tetratricopeptide repeat protein [Candidatus Omnitrophota bacterium]
KEDDNAVKMLFSTNRSIQVECYDLSVPPQVIIDFMGEIYTNKPEIMMVNKGVVKQMRVIRGSKKPQDLEDSFYSVDFIIVDLKESMRYDFDQGLTTAVLVVSKPGKILDAKKAETEAAEMDPKTEFAPLAPKQNMQAASAPAKAATQVSVLETVPFSMEDKEYEMPVIPEAKKSEAGKTTTMGKMKKGIKNFFTFGKSKKKEASVDEQIKKAEKPKPAVKKEIKATSRKRRKPREKFKVAKKTKKPGEEKIVKKVTEVTKVKSDEDVYENAIAQAKAVVEQKAAQLDAAEKNMVIAADSLKKTDSARKTIEQRIKENNAKQELLKADYTESIKLAVFAKNAANATWMEYSDAKAKLSLFLKNEAEAGKIEEAQKIYEQKKMEMSQAIKTAESAKEENEARLAAYEQAAREGNELLVEAEKQKKSVGKEQMEYNTAEETVYKKRQELANAKKEVQKAERDYQQYEMAKVDEEYKKSLFNIDKTLTLEAEKEERRKEEEILSRLKEEKAEQMRIEQERKSKEEARLAALEQLQKDEEKDQKQFLRRRNEKVEPKRRRVQSLAAPESKPETVQMKIEVLQTAVELRNSGLEMQRAGDFDSAVKYYQQALISDPKYATVHNDLGILYEQKGLNDKAKMEYLEALKINPHYIRAHSNLALLYEMSGDNNKAYYHWKQRVQLGRPDDPWTVKAKQRMELLEQQRK